MTLPDRVDVCVVGAGPAGLTVARELVGTSLTVLLLESGPADGGGPHQSLNEGEVKGGRYAGLVATRGRHLGGSAKLWNTAVGGAIGAKYLPLEPIDLGRPGREAEAWPLDYDELLGHYQRAQRLCGLGPPSYEAGAWATPTTRPLVLAGHPLESAVYQLGPATQFREAIPALLSEPNNVTLALERTVCALEIEPGGRRVTRVRGFDWAGTPFSVEAGAVVLAAGAIENARLLLAAAGAPGDAPGNRSGWLGRGFMEHPRDRSIRLRPRDPGAARALAFYRRHRAVDGTIVQGRLRPAADWLAAEDLPNASLMLGPVRGRRAGIGRLFRGPPPDLLVGILHLEQRPRAENRLRLGERRDRFGVPRPVLEWLWGPDERESLRRIRRMVMDALGESGAFGVDLAPCPLDPNAHHHAGTTRFHRDPRLAVADPDGRVHGTDNLFATGASLFPSAGVANPTLTIVALAIRLAAHLRDRLGATGAPPDL
ncbi:MAG: GMC oxidoreductase [Gemmatimonadales bacterium]